MYLNEMKQAGLVSEFEYLACALYTELTDVIITYENGNYIISNMQTKDVFADKSEFIEALAVNLFLTLEYDYFNN